jgi:hypothetical protein
MSGCMHGREQREGCARQQGQALLVTVPIAEHTGQHVVGVRKKGAPAPIYAALSGASQALYS